MAEATMEDVDAIDDYSYEPVRIERLEVDNFKSYKGTHRIGPFKDFTAVIGPNGSGKSNLMDAISFVLGVRTNQLRGSLKELLYLNTASRDPSDAPKKGFVKIVLCCTSGERVELSRCLQPGAGSSTVSVYKINYQQVTWEEYNKRLASFGILIKLRNFLVFQGDIETIAQKSPMELTKLFEQISGSETLTSKYDEYQKLKEEADARVSLMFSKKKNVQQELKAKREQKREAEKYMRMQEDLKEKKGLRMRFQLKQHLKDLQAAQTAHQHESEVMQELEQQHSEFEAKVEEKKKEQAGVTKKRLHKEKEKEKLNKQLEDKVVPDHAKCKAKLTSKENQLKLEQNSLDNHTRDEHKAAKKVKTLQDNLDKVKAGLASVQEEVDANEADQSLSAAALDEYERIKADVAVTTSKLQSELQRLNNLLEAAQDELQSSGERRQGAAAEKERVENSLKGLKEDLTRKSEELVQLKDKYTHKKEELQLLQDEQRKCKARTDDLNAKIKDVTDKLAEQQSERRENDRDRKLSQAVEDMKKAFPGVAGRLTELGRMPQQKYRLAVTVAMQKDIDSVVVDTKATSIECVKFLRAEGRPRITFIPLDSVKPKPIDERLRQLGGTAKLAIDLVEFDKKYQRAFLYALGNTLVCDTEAEGKDLQLNSFDRHKVVTVDGTVFARSGAITGGMNTSFQNAVSKWNDRNEQAFQDLKQRRQQLFEELGALPNLENMKEQVVALDAEVRRLDGDVVMKEAEVERTKAKVASNEKHLKQAVQDAKRLADRDEPTRKKIHDLEAKVAALKVQVNEVADKAFASFSRKNNIANIREYEEDKLKAAQELRKKKEQLQDQESKIETQLKRETNAWERAKHMLSARQSSMDALNKQLDEIKVQLDKLEQLKEQVQEQIKQAKDAVAQYRVEEQEIQAALQQLKEQDKEYQTELGKHHKQLSGLEHQMQTACRHIWDILDQAAIGQIALREQDGEEDEAGPSSRATADEGLTAPGTMDDFSALPPLEQAAKVVEQLGAKVDFAALPRSEQSAKGRAERERVLAAYEGAIAELEAQLAANAPNLKAVEQFAAVQDKERRHVQELEEARQHATECTQRFDNVRRERLDKFMAAFDDVQKSIDEIYKQLTTSRVHPMGGQAFLNLENPDEPFLHGIKYTAMPPTKRFRDMESLSGGEKTMAAVALLFAIHRFRPAPFFVLDEVDAALDSTNVSRLAHYIRNNTRNSDGQQFQSIVISLKDNFYEKADALVGVSRDAVKGCSQTLTLDLERFGPPTAVDA